MKKGVLMNFAKPSRSLFFNKVAYLRPATLLKNRFQHRCFPVNFAKYLRTTFHRTLLGDIFCSALVLLDRLL